MPDPQSVTYRCDICDYQNTWTRDEVLQRGLKEVYLGDEYDRYSLPCKNPSIRPRCSGRFVVEVKRKEG
jgi:hypothetical protein